MKKLRILILALTVAICISALLPTVAFADTGPKPFIDITVTNLPQDDYVVMFLSANKHCGPWQSLQSYEEYIAELPEYVYTQDDDYTSYCLAKQIQPLLDEGETYYLLLWSKQFDNATELKINYGYYPPKNFKLVIYSQSQNKVWISEPAERYAFASYFSLDIADMKLQHSYNYGKEIFAFVVRVIVTVAIELGLAFAFRFDKKSLIIIAVTNFVTQLLLNLSLNLFVYNNGNDVLGLIPLLIFGEIIVLLAETITYRITCNRQNRNSRLIAQSANGTDDVANKDNTDNAQITTKKLVVLYAFVANLCSLGFGILLWFIR